MATNKKLDKFKGNQVRILSGHFKGEKIVIEDTWKNIHGKSWQECEENFRCISYGVRREAAGLPLDDDVLYGEGTLVHVSEIELIPVEKDATKS